jgi:hypothetical protein
VPILRLALHHPSEQRRLAGGPDFAASLRMTRIVHVQARICGGSCGLPADCAVVAVVFPDADAGPGLGLDEILKATSGEDTGLWRLFTKAVRLAEALGHSHEKQGQGGPQRRGRLGDEADATGAKGGEDRAKRERGLGEDEEKAGGDDGVDLAGRLGERKGVGFEEAAIVETGAAGPFLGAAQERFGKVDAGDVEMGKPGGETAGVKARAAAGLDEITGMRTVEDGPKCGGDLVGVVGEEVFAAEGVLTPTSVE